MTIIAGFKSFEGIVLCADTQETVHNISKRKASKLDFRSEGRVLSDAQQNVPLGVCFCGAGEGHFLDMVSDRAWEAAGQSDTLNKVCIAIDAEIKQIYSEYSIYRELGYCPHADIVYAVKSGGVSRLFHASGPIINEKSQYTSAGMGYYMADYLASRMYKNSQSLSECFLLATYILDQAKEYVDGCGGESHVAVLRNVGESGIADAKIVDEATELTKRIDAVLSTLVISLSEHSTSEQEVVTQLNEAKSLISLYRANSFSEVEKILDFKRMFHRLFMPPTEREYLAYDKFGFEDKISKNG